MTVSAEVLPTCQVAADALAFGALTTDASERGAAQAAVTLECTPGTAYAVTMDQGRHGGRRMADEGGTAFLAYEIYQDAAATRRWGGTAAQGVSGLAPPAGKTTLTAYGRIVDANARPGRYGDVVTVVIAF